jgi:ketosteroid isomerase-like protein
MSNLEANKAIAAEYFARIAVGDAEGTAALFTENGAIILPSKTLLPSEVRGRDAIRELIGGIGTMFPETGLKVIPDLMTAEDNRVAVVGHSEAVHASGKPYSNHYHFLLVFEEGLIAESHEYMDTLHMTDVFFDGARPE